MKQFRTLKTLLLLMVALTAGNAYADYHLYHSVVEFKNLTFDLYCYSDGYNYNLNKPNYPPYATLRGISGTDEEIEVPYSFGYNNATFVVKYVEGIVSNSNVKKLTFQCGIRFTAYWGNGSFSLIYASLDCPALEEIVFNRYVQINNFSVPVFQCSNLTDIYFKGSKPSFTGIWSENFSVPTGQVTAHVAELTAEECDSLHENVVPWVDFKEVVTYSEVQEKVNITVTVEEAYAGTGAMFEYNSDQYIYGSGTKTYTKNKHIDYTFYVADGDKSKVKNVYVNGKDVYGDMTAVTGSESPFYSASNVRKYTIEDVTSDVSIRITSEETVNHYTLCAGHGGKIEFELENQLNTIENGRYGQFAFDKSQTLTVTATPYEGYEFDSFWYEGIKYDSDLGNWITMETQDDGTFVANLALGTFQMPYTDNSHVVAFNFKEKPAKPTVHIQAIGTPRNVQQMYFRVDDKAVYSVDAAGLATLSRTDTLEAGSKYKLNFANARYYNLKRITVNGEEIALPTGTANKFTEELTLSEEGDHILLEFDDIHATCSTTDGGSTSFQYYINGARNTISRDVATETILTDLDAKQPITLVMTPDEGFTLQLFFNGAEIPLADASIPEANIPANYMVEENGTYQFQIPAAMVKLGSKMDFAVSYKKKSFFDVNSDGEINVSDVT
ncbi:MAG: hypothetical protein IK000_08740 [Bacteroidaceae bacterium]|nr:hypothetical protein [Bacteroidaceae bacterium]